MVTLALNNGAIEVWIVDPGKKSVAVVRHDGIPTVFTSGDRISLASFSGDDLAVDEIFA